MVFSFVVIRSGVDLSTRVVACEEGKETSAADGAVEVGSRGPVTPHSPTNTH